MEGNKNVSLSQKLQLQILSLVLFSKASAFEVMSCIKPEYIESKHVRIMVERAFSFMETYQDVPGEHILDLLTRELESEEGDVYTSLFTNAQERFDLIDPAFVVDSLKDFIEEQIFRVGLYESFDHLQHSRVAQAKETIRDALISDVRVFDSGTRLSENPLTVLDKASEPLEFTTGIPDLDKVRFAPERGTVFMLQGSKGTGKTWSLINLGKEALARNKKVLHITLEYAEKKVGVRYLQNMFCMSTRNVQAHPTRIIRGDRDLGFFMETEVIQKPSLADPENREFIEKARDAFSGLIIKEFPTHMLTFNEFSAYIQTLRLKENFEPDLILVDYPDLFNLDPKNLRIELGILFGRLRGLAKSMDVAIGVVTQTNREGSRKATADETDVGEDWSKWQIVDRGAILSRTKTEYQFGLCRLEIRKNRDEEEGLSLVLCQDWVVGQWCTSYAIIESHSYRQFLADQQANA